MTRRTKAEMKAYREEQARIKGEKYLERMDKKKESTAMSGVVPLKNNNQDATDKSKYVFCDFIGTEEECISFMKTHNYDWIGTAPYLYQGENFRITYWKEV
jgi:hypothetical protein